MKKIFYVFLFVFPLLAHAEKEWTFLLYLNGNNDLDYASFLNINQMETVGSTDDVNLVVQWASMSNAKTQRILVKKDNDFRKVTSPVLEDMGRVDMGKKQTLEEFLSWGINNFPAKKYFVAVWNHGTGWHKSMRIRKGGLHLQDISWDEISGNSISTVELGQAIQNTSQYLGRKIDLYASDACLMGMIEVAAEMKGAVKVFAGSQELEPADGWPYDKVFSKLVKDPQMDEKALGKILTEEYTAAYKEQREEVTFSAFDMDKYDELARSIANLKTEVQDSSPEIRKQIFNAVNQTFYFYYSDYGDVGDFLNRITNISGINKKVISDAKAAMNNFVLANSGTDQYANAHGVSFWLPKNVRDMNEYKNKYRELTFHDDTQWGDAAYSYTSN